LNFIHLGKIKLSLLEKIYDQLNLEKNKQYLKNPHLMKRYHQFKKKNCQDITPQKYYLQQVQLKKSQEMNLSVRLAQFSIKALRSKTI